jgi:hypothetical protein
VIVDTLHPQLEGGDDPGCERSLEAVGEAAADFLRADKVQLRRLRPDRRREVDGLEFRLVRQAGIVVTDAS